MGTDFESSYPIMSIETRRQRYSRRRRLRFLKKTLKAELDSLKYH